MFLGSAPDRVAALRAAVERGESDEVRREAHTLKSNAATFGAIPLAGLCGDLEAAAKAGALDGAPDLLSRIEAELKRSAGEIERIRGELRR